MHTIQTRLRESRIVPVVTLHDAAHALPMAEALLAGGIRTIEITLRTPEGLAAIAQIAKTYPDMLIGAGTVSSPALMAQAVDAGAQFLVSPALSPTLASAAARFPIPLLPGVTTASEILQAQEWGFDFLNFFPAAQAGGVDTLKHFAAVFSNVSFCPTGGISMANKESYLSQPNVVCVGGSWLAPKDVLQQAKWEEITRIAIASREV